MMDDCHRQLLLNLKSVVEGLLSCQVSNVWNVYGGLSRLHSVFERILKHQFKIFTPDGEEDCWIFIEGLKWLQPSLAFSPTPVSPNSPPPHPHTDKGMIWLHNSLETHSLSSKLAWLVSDEKHLEFCYGEGAFLRHSLYVEAALICLRAVEQNQLSLLTEIHPSLYLPKQALSIQEKYHRRCSSFPDSIMQRSSPSPWASKYNYLCKGQELRDLSERVQPPVTLSVPVLESEIAEEARPTDDIPSPTSHLVFKVPGTTLKVKPWRSLPCLTENTNLVPNLFIVPCRRNKTEPSTPLKEERKHDLTRCALSINYERPKNENECGRFKRKGKQMKCAAGSTSSGECTETICSSKPVRMERKKKSFMEDGGSSITPMSTGAYLPRPTNGQSLTSFLTSSLLNDRSMAELDRENAHFAVCDAVIAAIEQVKCNRREKHIEEVDEESEEEAKVKKQRIRVRRRMKQEANKSSSPFGLLHASPNENVTTDQSFSPRSTDTDSGTDDSISTDDVDDMDIDQVTPSNLADINKSGLSLSMASLYSEADLGKGTCLNPPPSGPVIIPSVQRTRSPPTPAATSPDHSNAAECVALLLLAKFSDRQLPKASEIKWLVPEEEVPQQLLLMPDSVIADSSEENATTPLRGTAQWAPPRPQIIFTPHPPPEKRSLLSKQNLRCAGCGMKVAPEYAHRFRYCEYLARYFCTGCHSNKQALIPGKILFKWDFHSYPVSNFSYNLLEQMASDPLFNINDVNPKIYARVKVMDKIRSLRLQLQFLKDFLVTCKFPDETKRRIELESSYLLTDIDVYSLNDLVSVRNGELCPKLNQLAMDSMTHVAKCDFCQARGFICELCRTNDIIFPWQLSKVTRCLKCYSCQHTACLRNRSAPTCPKCKRNQMRQNANACR